jgi:hypothetical protein
MAGALGDAVLALDLSGRIVFADSAAARLLGASVAGLVDQDLAGIAPELAALARGLERGPAAARLALPGRAGPVRVHAALVRVRARPPLALAVLRPLPLLSPPPLPPGPPAPPRPNRAEARAGLAAAAAALRAPVAEAADALSLLRLTVTGLTRGADEALGAAEDALAAAARRIAELELAAAPGARRPVDLGALVEALVSSFPAPPGVRLHLEPGSSRADADDRAVRAALRELLGAAAATLPTGGDISVAVRGGITAPAIEVRTAARIGTAGLALARALVAPQGGLIEDEPLPGRGWVARIALEAVSALEPA